MYGARPTVHRLRISTSVNPEVTFFLGDDGHVMPPASNNPRARTKPAMDLHCGLCLPFRVEAGVDEALRDVAKFDI